jgi:hypothetical protein
MTKVIFLTSTIFEVTTPNAEPFLLATYLPVDSSSQRQLEKSLAKAFDENLSDDRVTMTYWVLMKMMPYGFSFFYCNQDSNPDRERLGARIREIRESKGIDAKRLAMLADIDAANLSRIEQGRYSVGIDILSKISNALGVKVDLV